jgi:hypothetical protein
VHQLTLRVPEELAERLKGAAHDREESVDGYAVKVLSAAAYPDLAGDEITGSREHLGQAGLLLSPERLPTQAPQSTRLVAPALPPDVAGRCRTSSLTVVAEHLCRFVGTRKALCRRGRTSGDPGTRRARHLSARAGGGALRAVAVEATRGRHRTQAPILRSRRPTSMEKYERPRPHDWRPARDGYRDRDGDFELAPVGKQRDTYRRQARMHCGALTAA